MSYNDISKAVGDIREQVNNVVIYEDIYKKKALIKEGKKFNMLGVNKEEEIHLGSALKENFEILTNRDDLDYYIDTIKDCFEISCYILYDRQILKEVIDKQKNYEIDYVVDFFVYVLRMFIKRYSATPILTKSQCTDIKELCRKILSVRKPSPYYEDIINRSSARDIIEQLKVIAK